MPRYIDAEKIDTRERGNNSQRTMWWTIKSIVNSVPTADVQEVRHGHFYKMDDGKQHCSSCGAYKIGYKRFCSYCGTRMDGDEK